MNAPQEDERQKCDAESDTELRPLRIECKFLGFGKCAITRVEEIPRGSDSETLVPLPVQRDKYQKISFTLRFSTAGEAKFFLVWFPPGQDKDSNDIPEPRIEAVSNRHILTLPAGAEGAVAIAEKFGEKFQITLLDLWEPIWISSRFGDADTISERFGSHYAPWRRECVQSAIAALEYRAAEQEVEKQHAEEERRIAEENAKKERQERERQEELTKQSRTTLVDEFRQRFGIVKQEDKNPKI